MSLDPDQLAALRREYSHQPLRRSDLQQDPFLQFNHWLHQAHEAQLLEPNAMILSTVDDAGQPWSRTVLLKACDQRGFTFFSNYNSAKGRQLASAPKAALTFWWGPLERQVNITGSVQQSDRDESERYFQSRPVSSQLGAWASSQSEPIQNRAELEERFAQTKARYEGSAIPLPPHWGGLRVVPSTIEFWQGRRSRLHDRLRYQRSSDGWTIQRLSP
jgi:pyridoxamine 5'-phosphate oxidase